ncbi:uncharacterized protein TNCT_81751 [Trichonephila clavata]|uniref:Uncharacterized protein n=1 Tax=Trichonephila clavata TaxID=2740835 RepID=A0A8X6LB66_TRICU|nr:uncharacterized protein TNCT_81751 [Trichonephila clavata]
MGTKMNIISWMSIFLIAIQTVDCDSSFFRNYRRNVRDDNREQVGKFDLSNQFARYRALEKQKFLSEDSFTSENDDTDLIGNDLKSNSAISSSLTESKYGMLTSIRNDIREKERNLRRISNRLPKKNEGRIRLLQRSDVALPKIASSNEDSSSRLVEPVTFRRNDIQRNFRNERETRLSDNRHANRERIRTNIQRFDSGRRMSVMRIGNAGVLKMAKIELSEFITPSARREVAVLYRETRFFIPTRFSSEKRERNAVRQQNNRFEGYFSKNRRTMKKLQDLRSDDSSFERNTRSKLQPPRYERHLLVPKRELKIPSEEMSRTDFVRRPRTVIRINALGHGNAEGTIRGRRDGRGLRRSMDQWGDVNKNRIASTFEECTRNQVVFYNYGRSQSQNQNTRSCQNSRIAAFDRQQSRNRLDSLQLNRQREISTRRMASSDQTLKNYNAFRFNEVIRIRFDNSKDSYRRQERQLSSSRIISSDRKQIRNRLDSLQLSRQREVSTRRMTTPDQSLKNYNTLRFNEVNRIRFDNSKDSYRRQERQLSSSRIISSDRQEIRKRLDLLQLSRQREVSARRMATPDQSLKNYNTQRSNEINRFRFDNSRNSNRHQERQITTRAISFRSEERIVLDSERNFLKGKEQEAMRTVPLIRNRVMLSSDQRLRKRIVLNPNRRVNGIEERKLTQNLSRNRQRIALVTVLDKKFAFRAESGIFDNGRVNLRVKERIHETRGRRTQEQARRRNVNLEINLDTRRFAAQSNTRDFSTKRFRNLSENSKRISVNQRILNSRNRIGSESESKENARSRRIDDHERSYSDRRTLSTNRRTSTEYSDRRMGSTFHRIEDSRRIQNLRKNHRDIELNRMENRFHLRIDYSRLFKNHRTNEAFKQSRSRITTDFSRKIAILGTVQTQRKIENANMRGIERRVSGRSLTNRIDTISKIPSTVFNSTARENGLGYSASRQRRMVPLKQFIDTNKSRKSRNVISAPKSSSSNVWALDIYEYLSSNKSAFNSAMRQPAEPKHYVLFTLVKIVEKSDITYHGRNQSSFRGGRL